MWFVFGIMEINEELGVRMKALRDSLNESQELFGERFGVGQGTVSRWEQGRIPKRTLWEKIAQVAEKPVAEFFLGVQNASPAQDWGGSDVHEVSIIPVRGQAAAGVWLEYDGLQDEAFSPVPAVLTRYKRTTQFAYRIAGPSMDKARIFDGDYVICVDYWTVRARPETGDIVVVERRQGQLIERTCKQIVVVKDGFELWPRSSDARFQDPIRIAAQHDSDDGIEVEVVGLVIGQFVPRG